MATKGESFSCFEPPSGSNSGGRSRNCKRVVVFQCSRKLTKVFCWPHQLLIMTTTISITKQWQNIYTWQNLYNKLTERTQGRAILGFLDWLSEQRLRLTIRAGNIIILGLHRLYSHAHFTVFINPLTILLYHHAFMINNYRLITYCC